MPFVNDRIDPNHPQPSLTSASPAADLLTSRFAFNPAQVMALLRSRIVGQEQAMSAVEALLNVVKVDIGERERPLTVSLFMGPTGVGKTEIVRLLALAIHGRADAFVASTCTPWPRSITRRRSPERHLVMWGVKRASVCSIAN